MFLHQFPRSARYASIASSFLLDHAAQFCIFLPEAPQFSPTTAAQIFGNSIVGSPFWLAL